MIRLIIILFLICYSCSPGTVITEKHTVPSVNTFSQDSLYIHLTGGFKNDSLVIEYADIRLIEPDVTTGSSGFAREIVIPGKGTDRIRVSLFRPNRSYTTEINIKDSQFVEVWYCKDDELKHYTRNEPFIYK